MHRGDDMDSRDVDRVGRALMGAGGCLTVVVFPLVLLGFALFGMVLAIGFGADPSSREMESALLAIAAVLAAIALGVAAIWALAMRGRTWAQVLMVVVGTILTLLASPFPQRLGEDYRRPEDINFTLMQLAVALLPAALALGAGLCLYAKRKVARSRDRL